ncbi:MAG: HD domain-containing protein [Bacteroidota bacterium]
MQLSDFDIKPGYFMHPSELHGANHTYRVMCHVLALGNEMGFEKEKQLAFFAAFMHDMARRHDGFCSRHGARAANIKLPQLIPLFQLYGCNDEHIRAIKTAVVNHSNFNDIRKTHPHYTVAALLKDADALDRIRIDEHNLSPRYLRFEPTYSMIDAAERLFYESEKTTIQGFEHMLNLAEEVLQKRLPF